MHFSNYWGLLNKIMMAFKYILPHQTALHFSLKSNTKILTQRYLRTWYEKSQSSAFPLLLLSFLSGKFQNSLVRRFILILLKLQPRELLKRISFKAQALLQVYFDAHKVIPEKTFSGK